MVQRDPGLGVLERVTAAGAPVQRAAVLGDPIEHSLSPVLHTAAYEVLGLTGWHYDRRRVGAAELAGVVAELGQEWRGLSLTMPLKEAAFDVATEVSERARRARSINTLVRRADGGWAADNTDVIGIHRALGLGETELPRATVLGAGATARSAVVALAGTVSGSIRVAARDPRKASVALAELSRDLPIEVCPLEEWADDPGQAVVSTLPPGGSHAVAACVRTPSDPAPVLLDVVYAGWPTPLARAATAVGWRVVGGLEMLIHQAAAQVELMTGRKARDEVVAAMRSAARTASDDD